MRKDMGTVRPVQARENGRKNDDYDATSYCSVKRLLFYICDETVRAFLPSMLERGHGHVVSINSMLGLMGLAGAGDYNASKFGALGLHEALMMEVARDGRGGVRVTSVHPNQVDTDMFAGVQSRFQQAYI